MAEDGNTGATTVVKIVEPTNTPSLSSNNSSTIDKLLLLAVEKDFNVEKLRQLIEMKEKNDRDQARKDYFYALSRFQSEVPEIKKTKRVNFTSQRTNQTTEYWYAPLSEIEKQVKPFLKIHELTYRWEMKQFKEDGKDFIEVSNIVTHANGHSERNTMSAPLDDSGQKNLIQQRGATITYLERYTLLGNLGLGSADSDIDANGKDAKNSKKETQKQRPTAKQWENIAKWINSGERDKKYFMDKGFDLSPTEEQYKGMVAKVSAGTKTVEEIEIMAELTADQIEDLKSQVPTKK